MAGCLDPLLDVDEGEFAGYVDSGIWMLEEWLLDQAALKNVRDMFFREAWRDYLTP